jgi:ArsR family transcriptional regulator, arsenate/arsenite/antimonite-responsive transcriptional repressor
MTTRYIMNPKKAEKIAKALADPNRLQIIKEIRKQKEDCLYCSEINDVINLAQPSICHHLKQLTDTEIIIPEKEGRNVKYKLNNQVIDEYIEFLESLKRP